jgi:hypothetical protein
MRWDDPDEPWDAMTCTDCTHPVGEHSHFPGHQGSGCRFAADGKRCSCKLTRCGVLYAMLGAV